MATQDRIGRLAQQIGERLQGASQAPEEVQKGVQQVVRGAFDRLELVSREDFDILMDVLQRTRARVESLEQQVAALEALVEVQTGDDAVSSNVGAADKSQPTATDKASAPPEEGAGEAGR